MARYGEAALRAVALVTSAREMSIVEAWKVATTELAINDPDKCPKSAFLGLCEEGLVLGIPSGEYVRSKAKLNKRYALEAVRLLASNENNARLTPKELWSAVLFQLGLQLAYNDQMEVVLELWNNGLICTAD